MTKQSDIETVALSGMDLNQAALSIGFDTQRIWATGAQVTVAGNFAVIVFREQFNVEPPSGDGASSKPGVSRNVASVVLPVEVARSLGKILNGLLGTPSDVAEQ